MSLLDKMHRPLRLLGIHTRKKQQIQHQRTCIVPQLLKSIIGRFHIIYCCECSEKKYVVLRLDIALTETIQHIFCKLRRSRLKGSIDEARKDYFICRNQIAKCIVSINTSLEIFATGKKLQDRPPELARGNNAIVFDGVQQTLSNIKLAHTDRCFNECCKELFAEMPCLSFAVARPKHTEGSCKFMLLQMLQDLGFSVTSSLQNIIVNCSRHIDRPLHA
mmetsp:Transcript_92438/g.144213  ORF Transcript_92438/g.144213 Transcript_92438/m.144213 type:complete len:219 (-) Transcript_92438:64-720(-)